MRDVEDLKATGKIVVKHGDEEVLTFEDYCLLADRAAKYTAIKLREDRESME